MIEVYDLRRLPENGETIDDTLDRSWLDTELAEGSLVDDAPLRALADGHYKIQLHRIEMEAPQGQGPVVHVHGEVQARLTHPCVRCLFDVELAVETEVDWTLFPAPPPKPKADDDDAAPARGAKAKGKKKKEPEPEPLDLEGAEDATYENFEIDLPGIVREAILLEVAMNPACQDEGACAIRTQALLDAVNPPEPEPAVDPRWAALEALKTKLS